MVARNHLTVGGMVPRVRQRLGILYAHRMAVLAHCQRRRYTLADDLYSANPQIECEPAKNRLVGILTISYRL